MRRLLPSPLLSLLIWLLWLFLANDFSAGQMAVGLIFAWLIPWITESFWLQRPRIRRPWLLLRFVLMVHWDIVLANLAVAKLVLGSTRRLRPAFVEVPLATRDEFVITTLASVVSLAPGTVSADINQERGMLLIHVLDVEDEAELVATIKSRYEAALMEIFGC